MMSCSAVQGATDLDGYKITVAFVTRYILFGGLVSAQLIMFISNSDENYSDPNDGRKHLKSLRDHQNANYKVSGFNANSTD